MTGTAPRPRPGHGGQVAHRSRAAGGGRRGGDLAVVVPLPDRRVGIGIADVAGHGPEVAELMARLRQALVEEARTGAAPADVLARLNARLPELDEDAMATAGYAVVDPASGVVVAASAGHLPMLCVTATGVQAVRTPVGPPLGVCVDPAYDEERAVLPAGATVLAYSDGLVERRGEDLDAGLHRLARTVRRAAGLGLRALVDEVFGGLAGASTDDVTLVGVRLPRPGAPRVGGGGAVRRPAARCRPRGGRSSCGAALRDRPRRTRPAVAAGVIPLRGKEGPATIAAWR